MKAGSDHRVIGAGNPDRGDDGAGRLVAARLRDGPALDVRIVDCDGAMASILDAMDGASAVWIVDACVSGAPAGTIRRLDAATGPLTAGMARGSTHGLGVAEAVELARTLGTLPQRCIIWAVEAATVETGAPVSAEVAVAIEDVAKRIRAEIVAL
jgi:hydrogenase maturation protease